MRDLKDLPMLATSGVTADGHNYLLSRGVPTDRLDALIPLFDLRYDDQERRVVFPVREGGVDLGYTARAIDAKQRKRWLSHPVEGGHKVVIYEPDRVLAGGDTLFVVEGPFDALMVTAAMQPGNASVATAFFGSLPTSEQLAYVTNAIPLYRMVYIMLDANVYGCEADINADNVVDLRDLATLLSHFGSASGATHEQGDLDADGDVDLADLALLLDAFGAICD